MVVDSQFNEVVSAIFAALRIGIIEKISTVNAKYALTSINKLAA
jgi:hypothetical protein